MAFAITNKILTLPEAFVGQPKTHTEYADQTAATTVTAGGQGDAGVALKSWKAIVVTKAYTVGTATEGPIFELQVADNAAFTTNPRTVATEQLANVAIAAGGEKGVLMVGETFLIAGQQFFRINVVLSGTATITFDAIVEGA